LKEVAALGGGALFSSSSLAFAAGSPDWKNHIGLELYTVRNLTPKDYEGTVAKVAEIGYKEVEPVDYGGMTPKQYRAMLDKYGLTAPSTHAGATEGPDLEKELEGFQVMGIRYAEIRAPRNPNAPRGGGRGPQTEESVKRTAEQTNRHGEIAKKFGMKMLIHNHTMEFAPLEGSSKRPYDVLLAETDPALVAMQLDIGWASVAGQNILEMFEKHPGRFELWHVKDAKGIREMTPQMNQGERMRAAKLVPVGEGEVSYKAIFAKAQQAGLKHFCVEQDNAIQGDSIAAAKTSYQNLRRIL
ncbi:MAG TPA: sugar phosphate isomerase/epimerase, partial [Bryobacteraceae bacterium]|nr:sugar phosphate isomerase/epimerase [Bryobacteraceae bacterium]